MYHSPHQWPCECTDQLKACYDYDNHFCLECRSTQSGGWTHTQLPLFVPTCRTPLECWWALARRKSRQHLLLTYRYMHRILTHSELKQWITLAVHCSWTVFRLCPPNVVLWCAVNVVSNEILARLSYAQFLWHDVCLSVLHVGWHY